MKYSIFISLLLSLFVGMNAQAVDKGPQVVTPPPGDVPPPLKDVPAPPKSAKEEAADKAKALKEAAYKLKGAEANGYHAADVLVTYINKTHPQEFCSGGAGNTGIRTKAGVACKNPLGAALALAVCYHGNITSFRGSECDKNADIHFSGKMHADRPTQLMEIGKVAARPHGEREVCTFVKKYIKAFDQEKCEDMIKEELAK